MVQPRYKKIFNAEKKLGGQLLPASATGELKAERDRQ